MAIRKPVKSVHDAYVESCKKNNISYKERKKPLDHIVLNGSDRKLYVLKKDGNKIKIHSEIRHSNTAATKELMSHSKFFEPISDKANNVHKRRAPILSVPADSEIKIPDGSKKKNLETIN